MPQAPANRAAVVSRPPSSARRPNPAPSRRPGFRPPPRNAPVGSVVSTVPKAEHEILFQQYFKSVNPQRTYAAQLKRANNGNHFLVLTEGKRDESTGEVRKTRLFVYSEDFLELFKMLQATAQFIRANPVPDEVKKKRNRHWARKADEPAAARKADPNARPAVGAPPNAPPAAPPAAPRVAPPVSRATPPGGV